MDLVKTNWSTNPDDDETPKQSSREEELQHVESTWETKISEEGALLSEEFGLDQIVIELNNIAAYLNRVERKLGLSVSPCPAMNPCVDSNIEQIGSQQSEIRELQGNSFKLLRQLKDLLQVYDVAQLDLRDMDSQWRLKVPKLYHLQKDWAVIEHHKLQRELEFGKCMQRYAHARQLCCSWENTEDLAKVYRSCTDFCLKRHLDRVTYMREKRQAKREVLLAEATTRQTVQIMMCRMKELGQHIDVYGELRPFWYQLPAPTLKYYNLARSDSKVSVQLSAQAQHEERRSSVRSNHSTMLSNICQKCMSNAQLPI